MKTHLILGSGLYLSVFLFLVVQVPFSEFRPGEDWYLFVLVLPALYPLAWLLGHLVHLAAKFLSFMLRPIIRGPARLVEWVVSYDSFGPYHKWVIGAALLLILGMTILLPFVLVQVVSVVLLGIYRSFLLLLEWIQHLST